MIAAAIFRACLPWFAALAVAVLLLIPLCRAAHAVPNFRKLLRLHTDQQGAVQSLSFVLTLPFFVLIILFIVQVSQIMIGTVIVHYAAYAAARSAIVWIPARVGFTEPENRISTYYLDPSAGDQTTPILDPGDPNYGPGSGGLTFLVMPGGSKYSKIVSAAALAVMPICPSRDLGLSLPVTASSSAAVLQAVYRQNVPDFDRNPRIAQRLVNKLAYAINFTNIEVRFFHSNQDPPLMPYLLPDDPGEFYANELGFQDSVTVTVRHDMAMLPGPGRFLARPTTSPDGRPEATAQSIKPRNGIYVFPLTASITLGNEGEKSVVPYTYIPSGT
ncbi:MAG: hypothetical protein Kow0040_10200 [Thermogutta sp.]